MLGSSNAPIQSEAVIGVSESDFDAKTSQTASDSIGMFKGPNVCAQKFSGVRLRLLACLFASYSFVSKKTSGFKDTKETTL